MSGHSLVHVFVLFMGIRIGIGNQITSAWSRWPLRGGLLMDKLVIPIKNVGEVSDNYHTFNELYEFRKVYNAVLFNEWSRQGLYDVQINSAF